jgi:FMN reductase [NAD(P)H]
LTFKEVVRRRRMVRNYLPDPVDPAAVERIVDAGLRGPSAGFTQGIYFVVVTDAATRKAIADLGEEPHFVAEGFPPWMSTAPVHIVVCCSEADYHARYSEPDKLMDDGTEMDWSVPYWLVDAGAALMLVLLAAVDEGLGAGVFGFHRLEGLRELLGIPDEVLPIGVVTIGHPAPEQRTGSAARGRRPRSEQVRHDHW